jgi:hypothetical protein
VLEYGGVTWRYLSCAYVPGWLTVAPKNGAIMAGRKGPAMWLRYGRSLRVYEPALALISAEYPVQLPYGNFELPCGNRDLCHGHESCWL